MPKNLITHMENTNTTNTGLSKLAPALIKAVAETQDVHADSTNPFHKSKYASLSAHLKAIKPIFAKHGLAIIQMPHTGGWDGGVGIKTVIIHESGEMMESAIVIESPSETSTDKSGNNVTKKGFTGQQAGALLSYIRRYALAAVAGVATEDDDAETDRVAQAPARSNYIPNPNASAPAQSSGAAPTASNSSGDEPIIPFGKMKGSRLSELDDYNLDYWANKWEPKPWEKTGKVGPKDLALKAAAQKLWSDRQSNQSNTSSDEDVPF